MLSACSRGDEKVDDSKDSENNKFQKVEVASSDEQYERLGLKRGEVEQHEDGTNTDGAENTYEWWYFDSALEDGSKLVIAFYTRSPNNPSAPLAPFATLEWTKPDGTVTSERVNVDVENFSASKDYCDVVIGNCSFSGNLKEYDITYINENIEAYIHIESNVPSWRPETGYRLYGDNEEYFAAWLCAVPDAKVTAEINQNGQQFNLVGSGYHDHNWGNRPIWEMQNNWYWGRAKTDSFVVIAYDIITAEEYGFKEFTAFMLAKDGKIVADNLESVVFEPKEENVDGNTGISIADKLIYDYEDGDQKYRASFSRENTILDVSMLGALSEDLRAKVTDANYKMHYYRFTGSVAIEEFNGEEVLESQTTNEAVWELMYPGLERKNAK